MRRILVIGGSGQVGSELVKLARATSDLEVLAPTHAELDIQDQARLDQVFAELRPEAVVNTSAFHRVDDCEAELERAFQMNAYAPLAMARRCQAAGVRFMHISTDYVFGLDRERRTPYVETDATGPCSAYGTSKLAGEFLVLGACEDAVIVRSGGIYGGRGSRMKGGNFVDTILGRAQTQPVVKVVNDQHTAPTFSRDLARAMLALLQTRERGVFHIMSQGSCTWYEFTRAIYEHQSVKTPLEPVDSSAFHTKAKRPSWSVLSSAKLAGLGITPPRHWREALAEYLSELSAS